MVEQAYRYIYFLNGVGRISIVDLGISLNGEKENRLTQEAVKCLKPEYDYLTVGRLLGRKPRPI